MNTVDLAKRIRRHALEMTHEGRSSHIGSVFSMTDIIAVLYGLILQYDPANPEWEERDRFILSKGHAGAGVYAALAECGFFPVDTLRDHCKNGKYLSGHISHVQVPGIELSTGSLGHGLPVACGMAKNAKLLQKKHRVFVILGCGECNEGSNWEAAMFAAHHKLDNLVVVIDYNKLQGFDTNSNTLGLEPFSKKWESFGWDVHEVNGHDHDELTVVLSSLNPRDSRPNCIVAHTIKGKGVSFMENKVLWHYRNAQGDEYEKAKSELS